MGDGSAGNVAAAKPASLIKQQYAVHSMIFIDEFIFQTANALISPNPWTDLLFTKKILLNQGWISGFRHTR